MSTITCDRARMHVERPHPLLTVERRLGEVVLRWPASQSGPALIWWCVATLMLLGAPLILAMNDVVIGAAMLLGVDVVGMALIRMTSVHVRVERGLFSPREGQRFEAEDVKAIVVRRSGGAFQVIAEVEGFFMTRAHLAYVRDASLAEAIAKEARALLRSS